MSRNRLPLDLRVRILLHLSRILTRLGILPNHDKVARIPPDRRKTIKPLRLLVGPLPEGVVVDDRDIPSRGGQLPVRLYHTAEGHEQRAIVFWLHGGGFMSGGRASADHLCYHLATHLPAIVIAVEYRLTPQHPFPAALEDCHDALLWVVDHANELGADSSKVAVMGESAGANLTAALCMTLRGRNGPTVAFQGLVYPGLDLTGSHDPSVQELAGLTSDVVHRVLTAYVGEADPANPLISPLLEPDLSGLPPALVITADVDPFREDGRRFAARLAEDGVAVRYTNYLRVAHGFLDVPRLARCWPQAMAEIVHEVRRVVLSEY